jgi:hypothetical protein
MIRLAPRDWFYSKLFREMLESIFAQRKQPMDKDLEAKFRRHDEINVYVPVEDPATEMNPQE